MSFDKNDVDMVLTTIHSLAEPTTYKKAMSFEVVKQTNIKGKKLWDILKYLIDKGYLKPCAFAGVLTDERGGNVSLGLTSDGISYVINNSDSF